METLPFSPQERDIDLLLLCLFHTEPAFVGWFAERAGAVAGTLHSAQHSVFTDKGETDVLAVVATETGRLALMIEDKIGAVMQPGQAARYHQRGEELVKAGVVQCFHTILCAPAAYLEAVGPEPLWQGRVAFEHIADWLEDAQTATSNWQAALLRRSGDKLRRIGNGTTDAALRALKQGYRAFAAVHFPQFQISDQNGRDKEIFLRAVGLPPGLRLKQALFRGEVSLIIEARHQMVDVANIALPAGVWVERFSGEVHLRQAVEPFDPGQPFEAQLAVARQGLSGLAALHDLAGALFKP